MSLPGNGEYWYILNQITSQDESNSVWGVWTTCTNQGKSLYVLAICGEQVWLSESMSFWGAGDVWLQRRIPIRLNFFTETRPDWVALEACTGHGKSLFVWVVCSERVWRNEELSSPKMNSDLPHFLIRRLSFPGNLVRLWQKERIWITNRKYAN